jgi:hypothetical protein
LTAAQCVDGALQFTIVLGSNNLNENEPNRVTVAAEEHFLNPNYDAFTLQHDIALIRLRMPVELTSKKVFYTGDVWCDHGTSF